MAPSTSKVGGLSPWLALALWELIIVGDGRTGRGLSVKLDRDGVKALESAGMITVEGSKLHVTDAGWLWANGPGFKTKLADVPQATPVFEALVFKIGIFLKVHDLSLADLLRPPPPVVVAARKART